MTLRRTLVMLASVLMLLIVAAVVVVAAPLLQQESAGTLVEAVKLQIGSDDVAPVPDRNDAWLVKSDSDGVDTLVTRMEADGFTYVEQLGAHRFLEDDDGEQISLECVQYSSRFQVCDLRDYR